MKGWLHRKCSKMPIPDYQSLMLPVLRLAGDRKEHPLAEFRQRIAADLQLSEPELAERLASDSQTVFASRVAWAIQYLKQAAAIEGVRRGVYKITDRGLSISKDNPAEVTLKILRQFPEFVRFEGKTSESEMVSVSEPTNLRVVQTDDVKFTPEESLENSYQLLHDALATEFLETIRNGTPAAFEKIVVDLLVAMGYGGSVEDAGKVVGKSGDGGIDGIIKQDKLGLDFLYVQAKRWKDVVGSPEVMKFSGSLTKKHANRGVFITTSWFSADALDYVREIQQRIILIDGRRLSSLMIEHNVSVAPAKTYTLKRMDQDYLRRYSTLASHCLQLMVEPSARTAFPRRSGFPTVQLLPGVGLSPA
jgi:restriction system protein